MKLELESLLNKYSQDIDLSDENKRSKLEIIKKITKNKDWDNIDIEGNKEYGLTQILLYEYSTSIEKLTNGKVSYKQVTEKLSNLMGKLRYGKWKEQDSGIKYGEISVTDSVYRKNEGKEFGAQTIDYIDENNQLKMAVIAYDRNEGEGINFKDINDIRQTFFHEWTHVMELDKIKTNQETEVSLNGRIFKNNEKKENGEIWGEGLVTREYGTNAKLYATNVDAIGNKRIMHNQIDEGAVELIARKVMGNVLGEERAKKVIDSKRYYPNVKVIQELMKAGGEERFITLFTTNSQKLISMLEKINIEDRDALHYMSDFVNDETTQGMIPKYSPKTNLYKEIQEKGLQKSEIQKIIKTDKRVQDIQANTNLIYESLKERILEGQKENEKKEINRKNQELLKKQRKIYRENGEPQRNSNIKNINLSKIPFEKLKKMAFHYSLKKDKNSIDSKGLKSRIARNSAGVDKKSAIYFSYGIEAVLETWDVWLKWRLNRLNNPKWNEENKELRELIKNGQANEEQIKQFYYKCKLWDEEFLEHKYIEDKEKLKLLYDFQIDEMKASNYYILDLHEGKDFSFDDIDAKKEKALVSQKHKDNLEYKYIKEEYGKYSNVNNLILEKWNMNTFLGKQLTISPNRIKQLTLPNEKNDVLSVIKFLYGKYKEMTPKEKQVSFDLLDDYMEYAKNKEKLYSNDIRHNNKQNKIEENYLIKYSEDKRKSNLEYRITPNQIGKTTYLTNIEKKDKAKKIVDKKINERIHPPEIENDIHIHNKYYGG